MAARNERAEQLLDWLVNDPAGSGAGVASSLLAEYQKGYPLETLRPLLSSEDERVLSAASFILSELGSEAGPLAEDAALLLASSNPRTRSDALDAILVCAVGEHAGLFSYVLLALGDAHRGVRRSAMEHVAVAYPEQIIEGVRTLLHRGDIDEPRARLLRALGEGELQRDDAVSLAGSTVAWSGHAD